MYLSFFLGVDFGVSCIVLLLDVLGVVVGVPCASCRAAPPLSGDVLGGVSSDWSRSLFTAIRGKRSLSLAFRVASAAARLILHCFLLLVPHMVSSKGICWMSSAMCLHLSGVEV